MDAADLDNLSQLSPFELKNRLIELAASHGERVMLNAGRGNPNFLAAAPRHAVFQLGLFAMAEAERCAANLPEGVAGLPTAEGIGARFETFAQARRDMPGIAFLRAASFYTRDHSGLQTARFCMSWCKVCWGATTPSRFGC